ncbi:MAG: hypothetical protein WCS01_07985 [bacterium]
MASRSDHCADCCRELGEPFDHVHEWLDALFKVLHQKHRSARHHAGGVEQVRKMWGDGAARAAEIHIMRDCGGVVPSEKDAQMVSMCGPRAILDAKPPAKSSH